MRLSINRRQLIIVMLMVLAIMAYWMVDDPCSFFLCGLYAGLSASVIIPSIITECKKRNAVSAANVANMFLFMIFVARPVQILLFPETAVKMHAFMIYNNVHGFALEAMPLAQAGLIGFLGISGFNLGCAHKGKYTRPLQNAVTLQYEPQKLTIKQYFAILVIIAAALLSELLYIRKAITNQYIAIEDLAWIYAFSVVIMYLIFIERKANLLVYVIIVNCIAVFAFSSRRQYIVNLLLYFIVPLYYVSRNPQKDIKKIAGMAAVLVVVVIYYGTIRRQSSLNEMGGFLFSLMDEFCMYDALAMSLKYVSDWRIGFFWGYNYLTLFTQLLPFNNILQFDRMLTNLICNGRYYGAMPTSFCGSLYLNFGYIGTIVGMMSLGYLIKRIEKKLKAYSIDSIGYYVILIAFTYDLVRVGDIGREFWTMMVSLIAFVVLRRVIPLNNKK